MFTFFANIILSIFFFKKNRFRCFPSMYRRARVTYLRPRSWWKKRGCMTNQYGNPREWFKVGKTKGALF